LTYQSTHKHQPNNKFEKENIFQLIITLIRALDTREELKTHIDTVREFIKKEHNNIIRGIISK